MAVVLAFASAPTEPLFLGPLGWSEIDRCRVWARPLACARGGGARGRRRSSASAEAEGVRRARRWPNHLVRDAAYLNWRYLDSPRDYRAYATEDGYAVLGHKRHRGRPVALVADLVAPARRGARAAAPLRPPGARRARLVLAVPPPPLERRWLAALGFVPSPVTLHFMGKPLAGRLDTDGEAWRVTLGDTDFF